MTPAAEQSCNSFDGQGQHTGQKLWKYLIVKQELPIRRDSLGVVSLTCEPVLYRGRDLIPSPSTYSAAIPLGKGLTVHYLYFSDGT